MRLQFLQIVAAAFLLLPIGGAGAQVYRWTDAQGQVHYGNVAVPAGAGKVTAHVNVICLQESNRIAARALHAPAAGGIGPGVHVIGQTAPVTVPEEAPSGRLRSVPEPFNAYKPRPPAYWIGGKPVFVK